MVAQKTMERNAYESAALDYAERGLRVFPLHGIGPDGCTCGDATCTSPGKHPRTPNGFKDAPPTRAQTSMQPERFCSSC